MNRRDADSPIDHHTAAQVRSLAVTVSGEGDFEMHSEDAWRIEAMTPHSVIVVRVEHGQAVVTVNGREVYCGR